MFKRGKQLLRSFKISQRGAIQLPIIIGLLIIGIALPAAVSLVQRTQETRRGAVSVDRYLCEEKRYLDARACVDQEYSQGTTSFFRDDDESRECYEQARETDYVDYYRVDCVLVVPTATPTPDEELCSSVGDRRCITGRDLQECTDIGDENIWVHIEDCCFPEFEGCGCINDGECKIDPCGQSTGRPNTCHCTSSSQCASEYCWPGLGILQANECRDIPDTYCESECQGRDYTGGSCRTFSCSGTYINLDCGLIGGTCCCVNCVPDGDCRGDGECCGDTGHSDEPYCGAGNDSWRCGPSVSSGCYREDGSSPADCTWQEDGDGLIGCPAGACDCDGECVSSQGGSSTCQDLGYSGYGTGNCEDGICCTSAVATNTPTVKPTNTPTVKPTNTPKPPTATPTSSYSSAACKSACIAMGCGGRSCRPDSQGCGGKEQTPSEMQYCSEKPLLDCCCWGCSTGSTATPTCVPDSGCVPDGKSTAVCCSAPVWYFDSTGCPVSKKHCGSKPTNTPGPTTKQCTVGVCISQNDCLQGEVVTVPIGDDCADHDECSIDANCAAAPSNTPTPTPTTRAPTNTPKPTATPTPIPQDTLWCNLAVQPDCTSCLDCKFQGTNPGGYTYCPDPDAAGCSKSGGVHCSGMCSARATKTLGCSAVNGNDQVTSTSARVSYGQAINACVYFLKYREKGITAWSDFLAFVRGADMWDGNHYGYTLTNLKQGTTYEWLGITENDDCENSPKNCGPYEFTTLCDQPQNAEILGQEPVGDVADRTFKFRIKSSGAGCYPRDAMVVIKADANDDGEPDTTDVVAGGNFAYKAITAGGGIYVRQFTLPVGKYVWRGRVKNSDSDATGWDVGVAWQRLEVTGVDDPEPGQITAFCQLSKVTINPVSKNATEGDLVSYTLGANAYTDGWTRVIRYKYQEGNLTPHDNIPCAPASDVCEVTAAGIGADDPDTAALEGGSSLWIFTNLSKTIDGTTYYCRFDGEWVHREDGVEVLGAPEGHPNAVCNNTCKVNVAVQTGCPNGDKGNLDCDSGGIIGNDDLNVMISCMFRDSSLATCQAANPGAQRSANITGADDEVNERDLSRLLFHWSQ